MHSFSAEAHMIFSAGDRQACLFSCRGIINSAAWPEFQEMLQDAASCGLPVIFDFSQVDYINSSSLGEFVQLYQQLSEMKLHCSFCRVHPDCLFLINLIGLDQILQIFNTEQEALLAIDGEQPLPRKIEQLRGKLFPERYEGDLLARGAVLLAMEEQNPLHGLLLHEAANNHIRCLRVDAPEGARRLVDQNVAWLAILDRQHPHFNRLSEAIHLQPHGRLACRVCMGRTPSDRPLLGFSNPETSGFSIAELAALARLEGRRRAYAEALLEREIIIELRSDDEACEMGRVICERLALTTGMPRDEADSFFFAVREAIDNACTHGNRLDPAGVVTIHYLCGTECVEVSISDMGNGFNYPQWLELGQQGNPLLQAQQRRLEGKRGGLGIMLMCRCCDEVTYLPPGNTVRLSKRHF